MSAASLPQALSAARLRVFGCARPRLWGDVLSSGTDVRSGGTNGERPRTVRLQIGGWIETDQNSQQRTPFR